MAFPSTSGSVQQNLSEVWSLTRSYVNTIKVRTQNLRNSSAIANVNAVTILEYATALADLKAQLQTIVTAPGLAAYAQEQINNNTINIVTEYNNMITTVDTTITWILTNLPKDGSGYLLITQFAPENNGRTISRQFTPAETAGLRTVLDGLLATID
jgi:hypothetical protein